MTQPISSVLHISLLPQPAGSAAGGQSAAKKDSSLSSIANGGDPAQTFLDYMKKSVAERMRDAWLAAHHLSQKQLDQMTPDERDSVEKQMAEDIKNEMKQQAAVKAKVPGLGGLLLGAQ